MAVPAFEAAAFAIALGVASFLFLALGGTALGAVLAYPGVLAEAKKGEQALSAGLTPSRTYSPWSTYRLIGQISQPS